MAVGKKIKIFEISKTNLAVQKSDFFPEVNIRGAAEFLRVTKEKSYVSDFFQSFIKSRFVRIAIFGRVGHFDELVLVTFMKIS